MNSGNIKVFGFLILAFIFSIYLGTAAATAQTEAIAWVAGGVFVGICLMLGKDIWILIPATLSLKGGINFLPGMIPPWVLMTMTTAVFFMIRAAVRGQNLKFRWTKMETALLLIGLTIIQALVRNPVGLQALGGESAGGKPYIIFTFALLAYYLINASQPDLKTWRKGVFLFLVFGLCDAAIQASSAVVPQIAQLVASVYTNVNADNANGIGTEILLSESRFSFLSQLSTILGLIACSFWRPLSAFNVTKPWRALALIVAFVGGLLSGFRSGVALLVVQFGVGSVVRRKTFDVVIVGMIGVLALGALIVSGKASKLPFGVQRVLTVIPIEMDLDPVAISQAEHSSADRFEVWRLALESDLYIKNKVMGDGFQFSAVEINAMSDSRFEGSSFGHISFVDRCLGAGTYHGFHVETIRFTGIVGLIVATFAMFVFATFALRAIKLHADSAIWHYVIFLCLPYLIYPLWYWLVFGSYRTGFPELIAMSAMVKVIYELGLESNPVARNAEMAMRES